MGTNIIEDRGDEAVLVDIIEQDLDAFYIDAIRQVGNGAFAWFFELKSVSIGNDFIGGTRTFMDCSELQTVSLPKKAYIADSMFFRCGKLANIYAPEVTYVGRDAFAYCYSLSAIDIGQQISAIQSSAFTYCTALSELSLPVLAKISGYAFDNCRSLERVFLLSASICALTTSTVFQSTPMTDSSYLGYFGSIYVPESLVDAYKSATNWTYYADRITAYTGE